MRPHITILVTLQYFLFVQQKVDSLNLSPQSVLKHLYMRECSKWCPSGRRCALKDGEEVCVCLSKCPSTHKPVCGSDGKRYENHCELHRTACVTQAKIRIDWSNICDLKHNQVTEKINNKEPEPTTPAISDKEEPTANEHAHQVSKEEITKKYQAVSNVEVFTEKPMQPLSSDVEAQQEAEHESVKHTGTHRHNHVFFAFGNDGIHVINPETMSLVEHISANDVISGTTSHICTASPPKACTWGGAVNAGNKKIYAADSLGRRLLVIDIATLSVEEEIKMQDHPHDPQYVHGLDEVWFTGKTSGLPVVTEEEGDNGTINVVSMATRSGPHHVIQVSTKDSEAHPIYKLHVSDSCHLRDQERFGYVTHLDEPGFHEVSLKEKKFNRFVNLSSYTCHGTYGFALSVTTGNAIAHCFTAQDGGQRSEIVVDLKTEEAVAMTTVNIGIPHISPDGRFVVTLNEYTISVLYFDPDGAIEIGEPIKTSMLLSDVAFLAKDDGYDVYVTSKDSPSIVVLHAGPEGMETADLLTDVGTPAKNKDWLHTMRIIVTGCEEHARYLATPSEDAVIVLDGEERSVRGRTENVKGVAALVWVGGDDS